MPPLPASLTDLAGRFLRLLERSAVPRLQSLLCDYAADVSMPALHEAIRALGGVANKAPTHLCESRRWLALEGELCAISDPQAKFTTNGVLLTVTADVKTPAGVHIITHCPVAIAPSLPPVVFAQTADATSRELLLRWNGVRCLSTTGSSFLHSSSVCWRCLRLHRPRSATPPLQHLLWTLLTWKIQILKPGCLTCRPPLISSGAPHGPRDLGTAPHVSFPVLNRFLTWLNTVNDKHVSSLALAVHLSMPLARCVIPSFLHDSLRHQWEKHRSSLPLTPAVTQADADFVKVHPQDTTSATTPGQGHAVQAQKSTGSGRSGRWVHSGLARFPVGCNVQRTPVYDPLAQPTSAKVLAGFLRSHFHDNLCTVLDEYVGAEVSFPDLGVGEEARAQLEQGGSITRSRWAEIV